MLCAGRIQRIPRNPSKTQEALLLHGIPSVWEVRSALHAWAIEGLPFTVSYNFSPFHYRFDRKSIINHRKPLLFAIWQYTRPFVLGVRWADLNTCLVADNAQAWPNPQERTCAGIGRLALLAGLFDLKAKWVGIHVAQTKLIHLFCVLLKSF